MTGKLLSYECVPLGFEMVIENEQVKAWNLWWNTNLTDDPERWDNEIRAINEMQRKLEEPTLDQRLIRAQIAEFCRENPLFPQSVAFLCKEIGNERFTDPVWMGCEGRGLLNSIGYHDGGSLRRQSQETVKNYSQSIKKWLAKGRPESPIEFKIFLFLGQPKDRKENFARRLISTLDSGELSISSLKKLSEEECKETYGSSALEGHVRPFACFGCKASEVPDCQCCYSMILDAGLLCVGTFSEKRSMFEEFRRFIEENVLVYSTAINSWLSEAPSRQFKLPNDMHYITKDSGLELIESVRSSLGAKDRTKRWLAACLLKTVKDNQRWHRTPELIDTFPQATSYLRKAGRDLPRRLHRRRNF